MLTECTFQLQGVSNCGLSLITTKILICVKENIEERMALLNFLFSTLGCLPYSKKQPKHKQKSYKNSSSHVDLDKTKNIDNNKVTTEYENCSRKLKVSGYIFR